MKLLYHPAVLLHDTGPGHPENRRRLEAFPGLKPLESLPYDGADFLQLVHPESYIKKVRDHCARSRPLDADTVVGPGSFEAATTATAVTLLAMEQGNFAMVRPPGHHAYAAEAHGFCLFNHGAIAAQKAVNEGKRVLLLDFDGHLGDGTMDIFYESDQVLYWSLHQFPAYPGNGAASEIGKGRGLGFTFNQPMPPGSGDDLLLRAFEWLLPVAAEQFKPDVVAISAGFDAHKDDPLLQLRASGHFYHTLGRRLAETFPGKLFATLEGGYNIKLLTQSISNFLAGINGEPMPYPDTATVSALHVQELYDMHEAAARKALWKYWRFE